MHQMYSSMKKPELKAHHDMIRKCMDSMGLAKCEDGMAKAEMEDSAKDAEGYRPNGGPKDGEAALHGRTCAPVHGELSGRHVRSHVGGPRAPDRESGGESVTIGG